MTGFRKFHIRLASNLINIGADRILRVASDNTPKNNGKKTVRILFRIHIRPIALEAIASVRDLSANGI